MAQSRMTKQRALILDTLRAVTSHPTADELHGMVRARMPRISLGTVYRNLEHLAAAGEILCLERAGSQKHFDGNPIPHLHARCRVCGAIRDVEHDGELFDPGRITLSGFCIERLELEFIGVCDKCGPDWHDCQRKSREKH